MAKARRRTRRVARARARQSVDAPSPIAGPDAFRDMSKPDYVLSQAATLLLIGAHLRGDPVATETEAGPTARALARPRAGAPAGVPASDLRQIGFPRLVTGRPRFRPETLRRAAGVRFAGTRAAVPSRGDQQTASTAVRQAANTFYRDTSHESAGALLEVALRHPNEL